MKENSGADFEATTDPQGLYPKAMGPDVFWNLEIFLDFRKII